MEYGSKLVPISPIMAIRYIYFVIDTTNSGDCHMDSDYDRYMRSTVVCGSVHAVLKMSQQFMDSYIGSMYPCIYISTD